MRYLSVCSGIEAATVAWHPLGWTPAALAEIEKFPSAVLKHHYPEVTNVGDFTKIRGDEYGAIDLLVGGTPCQDFSVAGLRAGMDGARGQLTIEFARLAERVRPRWLVWENVPGVLSIDGGRAFGTFLGLLGKLGYGLAYRVLDAQYFGVPQRRRRVFVVGHFGDWRRAAAVLFERHSLSGHPAPRREAGKGTSVCPTLRAGGNSTGGDRPPGTDVDTVESLVAYGGNNTAGPIDVATALNACGTASGRMDFESETFVTHSLRADGFDASEDGTGRGTPLVAQTITADMYRSGGATAGSNPGVRNCFPVAIQERATSENPGAGPDGDGFRDDGMAYTLEARTVPQAVAFTQNQVGDVLTGDVMHALNTNSNATGRNSAKVQAGMAVRRLTPRECERLQGFPDDYTRIPIRFYRHRQITKTRHADRWEKVDGGWMLMAADGPRYKVLGNSMAVLVMRWIGERIQTVEAVCASR